MTLSASDNVGVASVSLTAGSTSLGSDTTSPYSFNWDTTKSNDGSVTLTATAVDAAGNSTTKTITVTVKNGASGSTSPSIAFTSHSDGATVSGTILLTLTAHSDAGVYFVAAHLDRKLLGKDYSSPYTISFDTTECQNGLTVLTAKVVDKAGVTVTTSIKLNIQN